MNSTKLLDIKPIHQVKRRAAVCVDSTLLNGSSVVPPTVQINNLLMTGVTGQETSLDNYSGQIPVQVSESFFASGSQ